MKLYLVQHGLAVDKAIDPDRPLSEQGRQQVQAMAAWLQKANINVGQIHHSGKARAQQTAELYASTLNASNVQSIEGIKPNDDVSSMAQTIDKLDVDTMIVGHLPFMQRMVSIWTGINSMKIQQGKLTGQEASRLTKAIGEISSLPIFFEDNPTPTPREIHAQADWMIKRHGCKLVLFDGMYRSKTGVNEIDKNAYAKFSQIAFDLKTMARSLNIPVLVTHQLNRSLESRQNKRPVLSDLRESGVIEQEADKIVFLYRDDMYNPATEFPNGCEWIVAKHRNGSLGTVNTYYEKTCTKFMNATTQTIDLTDL